MRSKSQRDEFEVDQDLRFQKREWIFERIGWCLIALIIGGALLGWFGPGVLSRSAVEKPSGLSIQYEPRVRANAPTVLRFHVPSPLIEAGECRMSLSKVYLDRVQIKEVVPNPIRVDVGPEGHAFVFRLRDAHSPIDICFRIEPEMPGSAQCEASVGHGETLVFEQFVYP